MNPVSIKSLGHACFMIDDGACRLVIDPYDDATGYPPLRVEASMLLMSHGHHDHSFKEGVTLIPGGEIPYKTVEAFHDDVGGTKRGQNKVFVFEMNGLKICHCGDLGHIPTAEQYSAIGKVDVLFIPVGGFYTVDPAQAAGIVRKIGPAVVIPMHYKVEGLKNPISGVDDFLNEIKGDYEITRLDLEGIGSIELSKEDISGKKVVVLKMPM